MTAQVVQVATDQHNDLVNRAKRSLPGGTFGNLGPDIIIREGKGARVTDVAGKSYIDYLLGSGPMFAGHANPDMPLSNSDITSCSKDTSDYERGRVARSRLD